MNRFINKTLPGTNEQFREAPSCASDYFFVVVSGLCRSVSCTGCRYNLSSLFDMLRYLTNDDGTRRRHLMAILQLQIMKWLRIVKQEILEEKKMSQLRIDHAEIIHFLTKVQNRKDSRITRENIEKAKIQRVLISNDRVENTNSPKTLIHVTKSNCNSKCHFQFTIFITDDGEFNPSKVKKEDMYIKIAISEHSSKFVINAKKIFS
ncbi:hypothetical protein K0M31_002807 [Melipona bicolor]|uniref:Uncharacterized protein n=1 Tax=Melipona bicolor TaxID=60889 RepID=A0AA40FZY3_9HYME|nr:hypothetical protein K0M31_002807 [Melipona bicolor]